MLLPLAFASLLTSSAALRCETIAAADQRPSAPFAVTADVRAVTPMIDSTLVALYESGETFESFLAKARARREMWLKNWEQGVVPAGVLADARSLPGRWRLLVVAVDGCSDSVNTIPYIGRLVSLVPSIEMRIVLPGPGRAVMDAHRTPDGRAATSTVVLLDAEGRDVGCWVERPAALQEMAITARAAEKTDEFIRDKQGWYDMDAGASTVHEVVSMIAAAAAGTPSCTPPPAKKP